ncbi:hypothetical protein [Streptomyces sp. SA15]|uniref:hypothetical protein n=1 Tax=Streptomyces sp. SA15 TaxID=934019 RepID=UPI001180246F|nr:hypothetical protein [Streptomyces sp. SA15]
MYDLTVFLTEADGAGSRRIEWAMDVAKALKWSPERTADAFAAFLDAAVAAPLTAITGLEPLTSQEQEIGGTPSGAAAESSWGVGRPISGSHRWQNLESHTRRPWVGEPYEGLALSRSAT